MSLQVVSTSRRAAHRLASTASVATIASSLQSVLGPSLTTVTLGMRDPKALTAWARGTRNPRPQQEVALRTLFQITNLLMTAESPDVIRAWFGGMNPDLNNQSPAITFREDPVAVLRAAESFVEQG